MYHSFITLLLLLFVTGLKAQTIRGIVKDPRGNGIAGATVALLQPGDSSIVKLQVSEGGGLFSFPATDSGSYLLSASFVGFQTAYHFLVKQDEAITLLLREATTGLDAVVVHAKKPLVQVMGDRTIVNVAGTIHATGNNVMDLLRKAPAVTVSSEERIQMNGKNGVQVWIDGKPTPLSGEDLAAYLKSIPSSEVEALELITQPSSRYEAAGNAGIINVRLKKNKSLGTNGTATAGYNQGIYGKYNGALAFNYRTARVNLFGSLGYQGGVTQKNMSMDRFMTDTSFLQQGTMTEDQKTVNLKTGVDLFITPRQTLGLLVNGNFSQSRLTNNSLTTIAAPGAATARSLRADNTLQSTRNHLDFNINYMLAPLDGSSLALNADYGFYDIGGIQLQPNTYYNANGQATHTRTYEMQAPSSIDIFSFKADYEQTAGEGKAAAGFKTSYVTTGNHFQRYNVLPLGKELDEARSNSFHYKEGIHAAYVHYQAQGKRVHVQGGLRAEYTTMKGTSTGKKEGPAGLLPFDSTITRSYLDLFPSASIRYSRNPDNQFTLAASRRIDRPAYQDLNPFEYKVDDYLVQQGNAHLRPQYTHTAGLSYLFRQKLNTSVSYSEVKDLAAWILDTMETSQAILSKQNLASQKIWAVQLSFPWTHQRYALFANAGFSHTAYEANFGAGRHMGEQAFTMNLYLQNSLQFAKGWTAELTGIYNAPSLHEGNMHVRALWAVDAGLQKRIRDDRITIKLAVSDVFNTLQFRSRSQFAGQAVNYTTKNETRQVKLALSFRLGSNEVTTARQRVSGAEEELKRVH